MTDQVRKFDKQADTYEKKRVRDELGHIRRRLLAAARGKVLELGVGAGANLPYYRQDVELTAVDFSPAMLANATAATRYRLEATFVLGDVDELALPERSYDTVVSTLSICAYQRPKHVLDQMSRWCKPGGQILLLEHGISSNKLLAAAQRLVDPLAYRFIGCHQKRDIMALIESSSLRIVHVEHYIAGMLHAVRCEPVCSVSG